jgi:hypothetical protein
MMDFYSFNNIIITRFYIDSINYIQKNVDCEKWNLYGVFFFIVNFFCLFTKDFITINLMACNNTNFITY